MKIWIALGGEVGKIVARCPRCDGTDWLSNLVRSGCVHCGRGGRREH